MNRHTVMTRLSRATRFFALAALAPVLLTATARTLVSAQQLPDTAYSPDIGAPLHAPGSGPVVAIDAAHLNFHTADRRYAAFARLLRADGYRVRSNDAPFTAAALAGVDVLVIANAVHEQSVEGWSPLPTLSAFNDAEITALDAWIAGGGALMLIADHMPIAGHAEALAAAFGIRFQNGFVLDSDRSGMITFRRSDDSLRPFPAPGAGGFAGRADSVTAFTGQAFRVDPHVDATPLLVVPEGYDLLLPEVAWQFSEATPRIPAAYLLQGALVRHGRGRVAAFGEAAMFTAQVAGPQRLRMGMNNPAAAQNHLFALDVMRWLASR